MDNKELTEYLDQQRWAMNSGLIPEAVKNQLFFCGTIIHKDVQAVEVNMVPEKKLVDYKIYVPSSLLDKMAKYRELSTKTSIFGLWRFRRLIKKEGSLDFNMILNQFIRDYCGPKWVAKVEVVNFETYSDSVADGETGGNETDGWSFNQLPNTK